MLPNLGDRALMFLPKPCSLSTRVNAPNWERYMDLNIDQQVAAMQRMTVGQLRSKYAEVFGEPTNGRHKQWLVRRIAWRVQALAEGDLSERARRRAAELANDADLRLAPPRGPRTAAQGGCIVTAPVPPAAWDTRLPPPGTILIRPYKGGTVQVKILPKGFEYEGEVYRTLSAVANVITGSHCNGFHFFGLTVKNG